MGQDCLQSAKLLLAEGQGRGSINRSYYAAYCAVSHELTQRGVGFPRGWNNGVHLRCRLDYYGNGGGEMTEKDVAGLVRRYLQKQARPEAMSGITLDVLDDQIYREKDHWRVPVLASAPPRWMYPYYEVLAEVETDLEEKEKLNVLFVPLVPEEAEPLAA